MKRIGSNIPQISHSKCDSALSPPVCGVFPSGLPIVLLLVPPGLLVLSVSLSFFPFLFFITFFIFLKIYIFYLNF